MAEATSASAPGGYPARRLRRLRRTPALRRLVAEARLGVDDLVAPLFVREGTDGPTPIASMPGEVQHSLDSLVVEAKRLLTVDNVSIPVIAKIEKPQAIDRLGDIIDAADGVKLVDVRLDSEPGVSCRR